MVAETIGSRCACTFNHSGDSVMTVRRWIGWLAMAVVATLLLVLLAQNMGRERAMHDIERMNLVFGDVFRYSDHERGSLWSQQRWLATFRLYPSRPPPSLRA